jgi:outer membrane receptor for ferrienterochelin and colicins
LITRRRSGASRKNASLIIGIACAWLLCQRGATAQTPASGVPGNQPVLTDLSLEELLKIKVAPVFAASRVVQEVTRAPASVSIITREEIRAHGYRTLADVLRTVRGFYVTDDRNYSYAGVRGFARPGDYNCRLLVLVNGHRLNDTIFEGALLGTESPLDVALLERVEIVRGPSSSVYGTTAFFGVINLITRRGGSLNGVEAEVQAGSQARRSGRLTAGGRSAAGLEGLVSATAFGNDGNRSLYYPEFDTTADGDGIAHDADADGSRSLFAAASAGPFQLQAGFGSRRKIVPTGAFDTIFNDPATRTRDTRGFVDLQVTRHLRARTTLLLRAAYDQYDYDGTYAYDSGLFRDDARGAWVTTEATVVRRFDRHALTTGIEYRNDLRQNQSAVDETGLLLDDRRHSQTVGIYVEDEFRVSSRVLLNAGVRVDDYFDTFGTTVNPRVAVIVSPLDTTTVKVLYGRAFRAPNPYELYYDTSALSAGLGPERITTREIVGEQRIGSRVQVTASVFQNHVTDLITARSSDDSLDSIHYQNVDAATATGGEIEVQTQWPGHIRARIAEAFQTARDRLTQRRLSNSPEHVATLVVDAPVARTGLVAAFNTRYLSDRRSVHGTAIGPALVADFTLSRSPSGRGFGFAASAYNLFDRAYGDPGSVEHRQVLIMQDGRTVALRATYRF